MSPDRSHLCMPLGRSLDLTATLDAVGAAVPEPPIGPHATTINSSAIAGAEKRMRPTLRDELRGASHLKEDRLAVLGTRRAPAFDRVWQHANGLDMPYDLQAATSEYIGWLQLEANRSPNTVRAYQSELRKLLSFLAANGHSLATADLRHEDLRAYQRHLAERLKGPASRARALVAIRSCLRWLAREGMMERDLSNGITLPKLVQCLLSTGCRISEALALDRTDFPRSGSRLIVTGKGSKQRAVYLTADARAALEDYLGAREDACMALFVNFDRSVQDDRGRRLTGAGARFIVRRLRRELGAWSFKSPHVARHTTATTLLEVTGGDVRLVQEVLGHANLNTLQGYTKIVDSRKQEAYRLYQEFLDDKKNA